MSKYTPGPWRWVGNDSLWGGGREMDEVLKASDDGKPYGMHSAVIEHHWNGETAKANASLIAAAPDLLEALKAVQEACAQGPWFAITNTSPQMEAVRAAIAKATGETS